MRAANGDGSVYWSSYYDRFVGQVTLRWEEGKPRRYKLYGPAGDESRSAKLSVEDRLKKYVKGPASVKASRMIRLDTFVKRWIESAPIRSASKDWFTWASKQLGHLGAKRLLEITPLDVRKHLDSLDAGARTKRAVYQLLHRIFAEAVRLELLDKNPASSVTAPKMPKRKMRALTPQEVGFLLEAARDDRLEALVILALTSTMGPAELLALRRRDVNLSEGYLWVTGDLVASSASGYRPVVEETKTPSRRRRIDLPAVAIEALRRRLKLCLKEGSGEYVFTTASGTLWRKQNLRRQWWIPLLEKAAKLAKKQKATFPKTVRLYDLRHTSTVLMSLAGIPIEIASARMGHSSIRQTVDTYTHILGSQHREAADKIGGVLTRMRKA